MVKEGIVSKIADKLSGRKHNSSPKTSRHNSDTETNRERFYREHEYPADGNGIVQEPIGQQQPFVATIGNEPITGTTTTTEIKRTPELDDQNDFVTDGTQPHPQHRHHQHHDHMDGEPHRNITPPPFVNRGDAVVTEERLFDANRPLKRMVVSDQKVDDHHGRPMQKFVVTDENVEDVNRPFVIKEKTQFGDQSNRNTTGDNRQIQRPRVIDEEHTITTHSGQALNEEDEAIAQEMQRLNNILSDYRAEMLTLDAANRRLTDELQRMRQPMQAFEQFDNVVKECRSRSNSFWDQKTTLLRNDNATLVAEAGDLKKRLERLDRERKDLFDRNTAFQQLLAQQEADLGVLRRQNEDSDRRFGDLKTDYDSLIDEIKGLRSELQQLRSERDAFSQQIEQIQTETSDYERSIHELKQEIQQVQSAAPGQVVHSDLREDVEQIRRDYEQSRDRLRDQFEQRSNEFYHLWMSENQTTEQLRAEVADLRSQRDEMTDMQKEVVQYRQLVDALKHDYMVAQQKYTLLQQQNATDNTRWQQLKSILAGEHAHLGNRSKLYGEVAIYRDILEGKLLDRERNVQLQQQMRAGDGIVDDRGGETMRFIDEQRPFEQRQTGTVV